MATTERVVRPERYDPNAIEDKWQRIWEETGLYQTVEDD